MNQTYRNLAIILVDDGSPDNCPAMCDEWQKKDERIRVIHKENGGLSSARNSGLDVAKGELIGFVDSDDFILPEMYEYLYRLLIENDVDLSMCEFLRVNEEGIPLESESQSQDEEDEIVDVLSGDDTLRKFVTQNWHYVLAWNKLYRSHIFRNIRYPVGKNQEDEFTAHHILGECEKTAASNRKFYMYTQREDSITGEARKLFDARHMEFGYLASMDRYYFFRNRNMHDLAARCLSFYEPQSMLKKVSYIEHFREFNRVIIPTAVKSLFSLRIRPKVKLARFMLALMSNIIRDILRNAKRVYHFAEDRLIFYKRIMNLKKCIRKNKCAFVFGSPYHSNMGDQAQTYCIDLWLRNNYPDYIPVILDTPFSSKHDNYVLKLIRKSIKHDDMIFLHSGYHSTDLYLNEENLQRNVISMFHDFRIVMLPQTINYLSHEKLSFT